MIRTRSLQSGSIQNDKISMKEFKYLNIFEPASFRVDVHDATTELQDKIYEHNLLSEDTCYCILARPAFINWSATPS